MKEGVRTTTIKQASNRDVYVKIFGLHPDTRDEAVIRYLNAHGKVNPQAPVRYGVYGGDPSTNLLAGKRNGDRIYTMQVHKNLGSTHIIDGKEFLLDTQVSSELATSVINLVPPAQARD